MYSIFFKRILDFLAALLALILLSPLFILVVIGLFFANQGKPFFFQTRPGKNEKLFRIVKFKTMNEKKDSEGNLLSDAERLTVIGSFVRKTSLDEIPQLLNVLKGDMSLIGPRPLLVQYLPLYNAVQKKRHDVRPGITGWAQVNGRNAISWDQKFAYDVWYVEHCSLLLDLKILLKTIQKVVQSEGINANQEVTMEPFRGNSNLLVFGAGGHAKVVVDCIEVEGKHSIKAVLDDAEVSQFIGGYDVDLRNKNSDYVSFDAIVAIGNPLHREGLVQQLKTNFIMTIHPSAVVSNHAELGVGCQVFATAVINAGAKIGNHCIVNTGAIVEHDCELGDYVHVAPNATLGGNVKVGAKTHIGIGASIKQNVVIGKSVIVGAGAVVLDDLPDNCTAVGVPAKIIKFH